VEPIKAIAFCVISGLLCSFTGQKMRNRWPDGKVAAFTFYLAGAGLIVAAATVAYAMIAGD